jgi:hypothetical protein
MVVGKPHSPTSTSQNKVGLIDTRAIREHDDSTQRVARNGGKFARTISQGGKFSEIFIRNRTKKLNESGVLTNDATAKERAGPKVGVEIRVFAFNNDVVELNDEGTTSFQPGRASPKDVRDSLVPVATKRAHSGRRGGVARKKGLTVTEQPFKRGER